MFCKKLVYTLLTLEGIFIKHNYHEYVMISSLGLVDINEGIHIMENLNLMGSPLICY